MNRLPAGTERPTPSWAHGAGAAGAALKRDYLDTVGLIERLHRLFLDVIKAELDRLGVEDVNPVQALLLANIGKERPTVGELTARGYYAGANASYNVRALFEAGYLLQERPPHDRRTTRVRLSAKGRDLCAAFDRLHGVHAAGLEAEGVLDRRRLAGANRALGALERFWAGGPSP